MECRKEDRRRVGMEGKKRTGGREETLTFPVS